MGTFGVGPFDSDGALDLLDGLATRPADQRAAALAALLASRSPILGVSAGWSSRTRSSRQSP